VTANPRSPIKVPEDTDFCLFFWKNQQKASRHQHLSGSIQRPDEVGQKSINLPLSWHHHKIKSIISQFFNRAYNPFRIFTGFEQFSSSRCCQFMTKWLVPFCAKIWRTWDFKSFQVTLHENKCVFSSDTIHVCGLIVNYWLNVGLSISVS